MGTQGRTVSATVKLTQQETQLLTKRYGTLYKAMRAAVEMLLNTLRAADLAAETGHRHRRGAKIETVYVQGIAQDRYACVDAPQCKAILA